MIAAGPLEMVRYIADKIRATQPVLAISLDEARADIERAIARAVVGQRVEIAATVLGGIAARQSASIREAASCAIEAVGMTDALLAELARVPSAQETP